MRFSSLSVRSRSSLPDARQTARGSALGPVRFWTTNPVPSAQAALLVERARTRGERVCVLPDIRGALMAYTTAPAEASNPGRLRACDIILGAALDPRGLLSDARRTHPYRWSL